jgi:hypothetical protein
MHMQIFKITYVQYGLLMCVAVAACLALMELTGNNQSFEGNMYFVIVQFLVPFVIWYQGINTLKKKQAGMLSWKQGFMEGFRISLVFALVSPFVFLGYYVFVNLEILEYIREAYMLTGASDALVIGVDMVVQVITAVLFGSIYSAIIAFFLKSKAS